MGKIASRGAKNTNMFSLCSEVDLLVKDGDWVEETKTVTIPSINLQELCFVSAKLDMVLLACTFFRRSLL